MEQKHVILKVDLWLETVTKCNMGCLDKIGYGIISEYLHEMKSSSIKREEEFEEENGYVIADYDVTIKSH